MKFGYKVEINPDADSYDRLYKNEFERVLKTKGYPDIVSDIDFQVGQECFLVWIEYITGYSLYWEDKNRFESIGIFKYKETAKELVEAIKQSQVTYDNSGKFDFYYKTKDGQEFNYGCAPWLGEFERLAEVHLESITIEKESKIY